MIRTSKGARCRIEIHRYNDNREETFDADAFALTRLDTLLKERDVAQLDGEALRATDFTFRLEPKALNLIVPKGMRFFER